MSYFLFVFYVAILSWAITQIPLCKNSGLNSFTLIAIFIVKIAAGATLGLITEKAAIADTWSYHRDALLEYQLLLKDPGRYLLNIFDSGYADKYSGVLRFNHSYWNDLKTNFTVKLVSLLDIFSGGRYYVNVVLYNFLTFLGCMGLFRVYNNEYKSNRYLLATVIFLLPSLLLFGSSIHKDGMIAAATGLLIFVFYKTIKYAGFTFKRILLLIAASAFIFIIRNYVLVMLFPGLVALAISVKTVYNKYVVFATVYIVFVVAFFSVSLIMPVLDPPALVVQKQADFFGLERAKSFVETDTILPAAKSFAVNMPQALNHSLLRPYFTDYKLSVPLLPFAAELFMYQLVIVVCLCYRKKDTLLSPFLLFGIVFSLSVLLIIGYTVPVIWAIVRYRSIYLPFLLLPFLLNADWARLKKTISIK